MDKDMGFLLGYDSSNPKSIEKYAQKHEKGVLVIS